MKKVSIAFFVIFLCFGCFFKTNKLIFAVDPSEIQLSSNEMGDNRTSNNDIVGDITEEIHMLTLDSACSGGPVYFKEANTYFVLGNISGYFENIINVNYFTTYNSQQINLYNIITNLD